MRKYPGTVEPQSHPLNEDDGGPITSSEAADVLDMVHTYAAAHNRAIVITVIPLPDGTCIGQIMGIQQWGQDEPPHCPCGDDTDDHMCAHMRMIGNTLEMNETHPRNRAS